MKKRENRLNVIDFAWKSFKQHIRSEPLSKRNVEMSVGEKIEGEDTILSSNPDSEQFPDKVGKVRMILTPIEIAHSTK